MERFPELYFIFTNPFFDQTQYFPKAFFKSPKKNRDKSVLWLNGDVVLIVKLLSV